ncbi:DUF1214 domain-containing protein [Shewanella maritima]|uniref:DUF1214 domain-containing protein n=1 Tax=Shewanella maritima TaxID=2520507 RepID=UPI003735A9C3
MKKTLLASLITFTSMAALAAEPVIVTDENYSLAMHDMAMGVEASNGAVQNWNHHRSPIALDEQPAPMMNRDTLYSFVMADTRSDLKVTVPELNGRYLSVHVINQIHDTAFVFYGAGEHIIKADSTSDYVNAFARIQVDASNPEDVTAANAIQDQLKFEYVDASYEPIPFEVSNWDMETFMPIHQKWIAIAQNEGIANAMSDLQAGIVVDQDARNRGVAISTGLLPDAHASYKVAEYNIDKNECYTATYETPSITDTELGFFSITMYDENQYLATDEYSTTSNRDIKFNEDGTFTIHYGNAETGSCGEVDNLLHVPTDNISINMRIYLPNMDKIDAYTLPELKLNK